VTAPLEVDDIVVRYGEVVALDGAALTLRQGTVTGLVGMNGAGKSTLFQAIMGVVPLERGRVLIDGGPARDARRAARVSHVPQSETIDWSFPISVVDTVMMGRYGRLGVARRARAVDRTAVAEALARVELADLSERQIGRLSGGQRKRAFVARAIAQDAPLLLLDEPFAGVDARSESLIVQLLRELAAEGRTILVSTHDLPALPRLADDVVLLRQKVLFHGPTAEGLRSDRLASAFGLDLASDEGAA
jgi:manganese transport system ATP-binding protein